MRLLLDTHVYLWWLRDDERLWTTARDAIGDPGTMVFISAATIWEITIKASLGKLEVDGDVAEEIEANRFTECPMSVRHAAAAGRLPRHHDDPFDRMLIAQANLEDLALVSKDAKLHHYQVRLFDS